VGREEMVGSKWLENGKGWQILKIQKVLKVGYSKIIHSFLKKISKKDYLFLINESMLQIEPIHQSVSYFFVIPQYIIDEYIHSDDENTKNGKKNPNYNY
jgi:hypothetical protein